MTRRLYIATLLLLSLTCSAYAQRMVKVRPILNKDKESNEILAHIADGFVLTVPQGRTLDSIENDILCSFRIGSEGQLQNTRIVNQANARDVVELKSAPTLDIWLQVAILEGLKVVPPCPRHLRRNSRLQTIVFSFGKSRPNPMAGKNIGFDANGIAQQINDKFDAAQQELITKRQQEQKQWFDYTDTNIKETSKPKQSLTLPTAPTLQPNNPLDVPPLPDQPQTVISIKLQ